VEIESCAAGGGRVDLGILERTDRVWASDTNDALERQTIQRWTGLLLPAELVGAHIGPPTAHTTGRTHRLSFRAATALFNHLGIEWDLGAASPQELDALASVIAFYKDLRGLLHGGEVVRADHPDPAAWVHGVVAPDRRRALFAYVQRSTSATQMPGAAFLPGLDDARGYRVEPVHPAGEPSARQAIPPPWYADGGVTLTGRALATTGLQMPVLDPEEALLLQVRALHGAQPSRGVRPNWGAAPPIAPAARRRSAWRAFQTAARQERQSRGDERPLLGRAGTRRAPPRSRTPRGR
jgi:alpha-galactosidase